MKKLNEESDKAADEGDVDAAEVAVTRIEAVKKMKQDLERSKYPSKIVSGKVIFTPFSAHHFVLFCFVLFPTTNSSVVSPPPKKKKKSMSGEWSLSFLCG